MSKVYGLSGVRVAYLATSKVMVSKLKVLSPPWSIGLIGQIAGVIALLWWIQNTGLAGINPLLPTISGITLGLLAAAVLLGTVLLLLTTALGKDILFTRFLRGIVIKFLFPLIEFIGKLIGIQRDTIRQSFIAMNNSLVLSQKILVKAFIEDRGADPPDT